MDKKERINKIITELKKIENDDEVEVRFEHNVIEYQFKSFSSSSSYAILKNVIEIISKRPVEIGDDLLGFMDKKSR